MSISLKKLTSLNFNLDVLMLKSLCFVLFSCAVYAQNQTNFIRLDASFLSSTQIEEDQYGYLWFSDPDGLIKYNGYDYTLLTNKTIFGQDFINDREFIFKKDTKKNIWASSPIGGLVKIGANGTYTSYNSSLTKENELVQITSIVSKDNRVWFGSLNGSIYTYNETAELVEELIKIPLFNNVPQKIKSMAISSPDVLWVSTSRGKIYHYTISTNTVEELMTPIANLGHHQDVYIVFDKQENLWFTSEINGIFRYDLRTNSYKQFDHQFRTGHRSKFDMFITIFCDSSGIIWAGTDGDGLVKIDAAADKTTYFRHNEVNKFSISNNTITSIKEDSHGNIWVVTKKGRVNILPKSYNQINYFNGLEDNTPTQILSILKASNGSTWLGTDGKGLNRVLNNNTKYQYASNKSGDFNFTGRYIQGLAEDDTGAIWIGTYQNGLWVYNPISNQFKKINTPDSKGTLSTDIRNLFHDSNNRIWVASSLGITVFNHNYETIAIFDYNSKGLNGKLSHSMTEDENKDIWIGLDEGGLYKLREDQNDFKNSIFEKYNFLPEDNSNLYNYNISQLKPDFNGHLWILPSTGFLVKFNLETKNYESYIDDENLRDLKINSILVQDANNLWLGSSNGIHHYILDSKKTVSFFHIDGLQGNTFVRRSSFKDSNGMLFFGGEDGANSFDPKQMERENSAAKLYINAIEVLNKPADLIIGDQLKSSIEEISHLELTSDQSSFSFQFSAIDNVLNSNFHYAYRLKGFDKDWITAKKERIATYTNIPYGHYTFEVKAGSKKSEWEIEPKTIDIHIRAPIWLSFYAYVVYAVVFILLILGFITWFNLKNKLAKEAWQNNQEKELYALKMNFFAKMSHEIQTPLTLILGPIGDMLERAGQTGNQLLNQRLSMIKNNAQRLSRIATELMTVRNKELGKLRILASYNNLTKHLKNIALSFSEQARFKNIDFILEFPDNDIHIWYDSEKIEHVVYNLLSNAFKFTPTEGSVVLKIVHQPEEKSIEIKITDSGAGIPADELEDIFKLFYRSELSKNTKGSGIGLALSKELISLHQGNIDVRSSSDKGTCFCVKLSTDETIFKPSEKIEFNAKESMDDLAAQIKSIPKGEIKAIKNASKLRFKLLVVEDNVEMQIFLRDLLTENFDVHIAENGLQGIELANEHQPDLIISDIMMPVMNGIDMCKALQKQRATSHIPIILLTAKNTTKTKLSGLKSGAIEYIRKPFNIQELLLKINNILRTRDQVLSKYKTDQISTPNDTQVKSKDVIFLEKLVESLSDHIEDPDFKLEELATILNMSYSVIYRKCQEITGKTLVEFVRSLKVRRAAILILKQRYNISEAAFMVGYKDSKYFTKCFKEEFGLAPNLLKKESQKNGLESTLKKYQLN